MFLWFVGLGIICAVVYDLLRAFRREVKHGTAWVIAEDVFFCAAACISCYGVFFQKNHGALRAYGFLGFFLGAEVYHLTVSRWVRAFFTWCWKAVLFPFRWLLPKCKKWKSGRKMLTNRKG